ncbi:hypothetical protein [Thermopirellula anaerolimosa]
MRHRRRQHLRHRRDYRLLSDGTERDLYRAEGNRTLRSIATRANGPPDPGDTDITQYNCVYRNRLTRVEQRAT